MVVVNPSHLRLPGGDVEVFTYHKTRQRPLLVLHGFRGSHDGLERFAAALTGFRLIIPDLPGYGQSPPFRTRRHDFAGYAKFLDELLDKLHLRSVDVLGHSFGATLALLWAARHPKPLRRLVLVTPVVSADTPTARIGELYYRVGAALPERPRRAWVGNAALNRMTSALLTSTDDRDLRQAIAREEKGNLDHLIPRVEIESFLGFYRSDTSTAARAIAVPTLVVAAQRDRLASPRSVRTLAGEIPGAIVRTLPGVGHFVQNEDAPALARTVTEFLR